MRSITLCALMTGCYTEFGVSDTCELVGQYMLCHQTVGYYEAWDYCSDNDMVLVGFWDMETSAGATVVYPDKYKEVYLLGSAEFNYESFWVDSGPLSYECTVMHWNDLYPDRCRASHPFMCEVY